MLPELDPEVDKDEVFSHLGNVQNNGVTKICLFFWLVYKSTKNAFGRRYLLGIKMITKSMKGLSSGGVAWHK